MGRIRVVPCEMLLKGLKWCVIARVEVWDEFFDPVGIDFVEMDVGFGVEMFLADLNAFLGCISGGFAQFGVEDVDKCFTVFAEAMVDGNLRLKAFRGLRRGRFGADFVGGVVA